MFADPQVTVKYIDVAGPVMDKAPETESYAPPPLRRDVFVPLEKIAASMWPGAPVIPTMATGASDAVYTNAAGLSTYGVSGIAIDRNDIRAHGKDERLPIDSFYSGLDFYYRYLKAITSE
jgi:acetylornithine deacetylase/succinyl-diaminopimelate desuccinylase-like protein